MRAATPAGSAAVGVPRSSPNLRVLVAGLPGYSTRGGAARATDRALASAREATAANCSVHCGDDSGRTRRQAPFGRGLTANAMIRSVTRNGRQRPFGIRR